MRIRNVEVFDLNVPEMTVPWHPVLVRINTDEGISGVGEAGLAYGCGHSGAAGMLVNLAEQFLIGADPLPTEAIWNAMQRHSFWGLSPGPVLCSAISAIDMALWDIKGKVLNQPVYNLLGGPFRTQIRAYASQVQFGWGPGNGKNLYKPDDYSRETETMLGEGYTAVKVNPVRYNTDGSFLPELTEKVSASLLNAMYDRVKAVREAGSPDLDILVECNSRCSTAVAIQLGQRLEDLNCMYMEEPVHFMNPVMLEDIKRSVNIPLAGGERLYTRWQFLPFLEKRLIGLAQPDIGLAGGITEVKKICDLAQIYDIGIQIHICGSPVCMAAALHMAAAVPNYSLHEHHVNLLKPSTRAIVHEDYQPEHGFFMLPKGPGLGIELNDAVVTKSPMKVVS